MARNDSGFNSAKSLLIETIRMDYEFAEDYGIMDMSMLMVLLKAYVLKPILFSRGQNEKAAIILKHHPLALVFSGAIINGGGGNGDVVKEEPPAVSNPTTVSGWVSAANWDNATPITINMRENADGTLRFDPNTLAFTAGKPYILKVINPVGNASKHYFSTEGAAAFVEGFNFYKAIATRKVQTSDAEYKAPYFKAVEMLVPSVSNRELEIFFVAVVPGTYAFYCEITGHEARGMTGTITIETPSGAGAEDFTLDLEVASDYNVALADDPRLSGSHAVWATATNLSVTLTETTSTDFSFVPDDLDLINGQAYKLTITNPSGNSSKHYWYDESDASGNFFRTAVFRKAQDSHAEIKPYYLKAVELRAPSSSNSTDLYFVPTVSGNYWNACTIPGHKELGMTGTITVTD